MFGPSGFGAFGASGFGRGGIGSRLSNRFASNQDNRSGFMNGGGGNAYGGFGPSQNAFQNANPNASFMQPGGAPETNAEERKSTNIGRVQSNAKMGMSGPSFMGNAMSGMAQMRPQLERGPQEMQQQPQQEPPNMFGELGSIALGGGKRFNPFGSDGDVMSRMYGIWNPYAKMGGDSSFYDSMVNRGARF